MLNGNTRVRTPQGIIRSCHWSSVGGSIPAERWREMLYPSASIFLLCQATSQEDVGQANFRTSHPESSALDPAQEPRRLLLNLAVKGHIWTQKPFFIKVDLSFGSG